MTHPARFLSFARTILLGMLALAGAAAPLRAQNAPPADTQSLRQFSGAVEALIRRVSPSVVQVLVTGYGAQEETAHGSAGVIIGRQRAIGSGFIVDPAGYIITNAHVVAGAQSVQVLLPSAGPDLTPKATLANRGSAFPARIVGADRDMDLALLKIDGSNLPALNLARYPDLRQGQVVFALGSPQGLRNSVTMGVVSAVARQLTPDSPFVFIQTDTAINPGNSGGPLVNVNGEVVGVNTFILTQSGGNEGLGFAIPSSLIHLAYSQMRKFGHVHRGEIGVGLQSITPELAAGLKLPRDSGVIVSDVLPGSPAETAGLRVEDILVTIEGQAADSVPYVAFRLLSLEPGQTAHLEVLRGSGRVAMDVPVAHRPHQMDELAALADAEKSLVKPLGFLGVAVDERVAKALPQLRDPFGILVLARSADSTADVPLSTGDVIRTLNGQRMTTLDDLREALKAVPSGSTLVLQIQRDTRLLFVTFVLEQP